MGIMLSRWEAVELHDLTVFPPAFYVPDMYANQGGISSFTVHRASFWVLQLHVVFDPFCSRHCRNEHLPARLLDVAGTGYELHAHEH